ncbi:hypothetical protein [Polaromonas sp.]|uniref:hypothetical protein n=1 Tax=Polaromonas sp. TaxID=1869339 RepID=UPI003BB7B70C
MNAEKNIAPTALRDYLVKAQGWEVLDIALPDRLFVLNHKKYPRRQLVYPMDSTAPDYDEAVSRVFEKLSECTQQMPVNLMMAAQNLRDDIISLRIHAENQGYTLPLSFATTLIQSTEKLLKSAACTVLQPMRHHRKLYRSEVSQFIQKARFQQTERGSFVLKVACPIDAVQAQGNLEFESVQSPFSRQVTATLQKSISTLVTAIEADKLDQLMDELGKAEKPLISSNLCEALAEMQDEEIENSLDFGVNWSALYALPSDMAGIKVVRLQRDYFRRIEEVGQSLRSKEPHREDIYIGTVERLDGVMDETGHRAGDVRLSLMLPEEDGLVKAKVWLNADNYVKAIRAHEADGAYVQVKGRLQAGQRLRQITHLTSFELVANTSAHQP